MLDGIPSYRRLDADRLAHLATVTAVTLPPLMR